MVWGVASVSLAWVVFFILYLLYINFAAHHRASGGGYTATLSGFQQSEGAPRCSFCGEQETRKASVSGARRLAGTSNDVSNSLRLSQGLGVLIPVHIPQGQTSPALGRWKEKFPCIR